MAEAVLKKWVLRACLKNGELDKVEKKCCFFLWCCSSECPGTQSLVFRCHFMS